VEALLAVIAGAQGWEDIQEYGMSSHNDRKREKSNFGTYKSNPSKDGNCGKGCSNTCFL